MQPTENETPLELIQNLQQSENEMNNVFANSLNDVDTADLQSATPVASEPAPSSEPMPKKCEYSANISKFY